MGERWENRKEIEVQEELEDFCGDLKIFMAKLNF